MEQKMSQQRHAPFLIDGKAVEALEGGTISVRNPANGSVVGTSAYGTAADADRALAAAQAAFPGWAATDVEIRARLLRRTGELIRLRRMEIAQALTSEQGKPITDSLREIDYTARVFEFYADMAPLRADAWKHPQENAISKELRVLVIHQPLGVVVTMVPWNYPVDIFAWKVAPALAAGCTVVNKPSPLTPLSTALTVQCLVDAGVPAGVINNVVGSNEGLSMKLIRDPRSRLVTLTGSIETGQMVMREAATELKRIVLELGGQCPMIVMPDADLDLAVAAAVQRSYTNMGQICLSVNRIYVAEKIRGRFLDAFVEATRAVQPMDGAAPGALFGPMINDAQIERVQNHVQDAVARGGKLLAGGRRLTGAGYDGGSFFAPTVLADTPDDALVMCEETFGPVAPVVGYASTEELIRRANATRFGLAAYVYSQDIGQALQLAERLEFGGVGINVNDVCELQAPFGGWKHSGVGRELGSEGLLSYMEAKHIRMRLPALV
jgi:succinate-semialdehyde dehydrogenase / glutarate-semialdehyde dehydrogenase